MKRLKNKLLAMDVNTSTYNEMYDGLLYVVDPASPGSPSTECSDPIYYNDTVGFQITKTHKLAQDKPTVLLMIPLTDLFQSAYTELSVRMFEKSELKKAVADFFLREFAPYIDNLNAKLYNHARPENENGWYYLYRPGGEVLIRNTAYFDLCTPRDYRYLGGNTVALLDDGVSRSAQMCLCIRIQVQLPKRKMRKTIQMLCHDLPNAVDRFINEFNIARLETALAIAEKQVEIRAWLRKSNYCAFIANGSILPRSKQSDLPMVDAIPFQSTPNDEIEICGVRGMGIKKGVTVITGGGYSGKSTLLDAISAGIYDHVVGDGRELCITDDSAVTISAEDGRSVKSVNISPFIKWLPGGDTADFSTDHASGSTSQAANIMEAVECGAKLLLIDEDRSATNFMIRDKMMKDLINKEPITPFTDRVGELASTLDVSTILVIGGSGEYLSVADKIYMMEDYLIQDVTAQSKSICKKYGVIRSFSPAVSWEQQRMLLSERFTSYPERSGSERLEVSDVGIIIIGDEKIDVRGMHDIITTAQLDALGFMLRYLQVSNREQEIDLASRIDELYQKISEKGIDFVYSSYFTTCARFLDLPRKAELIAVINRMRKILLRKRGE